MRQSCTVFAVCMGKQCKGDSAIVDLGRANHYRLAFPVRSVRLKLRRGLVKLTMCSALGLDERYKKKKTCSRSIDRIFRSTDSCRTLRNAPLARRRHVPRLPPRAFRAARPPDPRPALRPPRAATRPQVRPRFLCLLIISSVSRCFRGTVHRTRTPLPRMTRTGGSSLLRVANPAPGVEASHSPVKNVLVAGMYNAPPNPHTPPTEPTLNWIGTSGARPARAHADDARPRRRPRRGFGVRRRARRVRC